MFKPNPTYEEWMSVYREVEQAVGRQFPSIGLNMLKFLLETPKPEQPKTERKRF